MTTETAEQLHRLLGSALVSARPVRGGYTPASRWVVKLSDGSTAFVKQAVHESVVARLRREHETYSQLSGPWLPEVLAFEDGAEPTLVLEDLSQCYWPPPWRPGQVEMVQAALAGVATHPVPPGLGRALATDVAEGGWPEVERDPRPFLGLGLCSGRWLEHALPRLLDAADPRGVRGIQLRQLAVALPWAAGALGLEPPDGV